LSATSTGIGVPSTAIAVEELAKVGARGIHKSWYLSTLKREIRVGDLIIYTSAVRLEGTSKHYVILKYPAVASYDVVLALIDTAENS